MPKILIFDCEIINCIPPQNDEDKNPNLNYCKGWRDFKNMGISVIGTWRNYDLVKIFGNYYTIPLPSGKYQAFVNHNSLINAFSFPDIVVKDFEQFLRLAMISDCIVGFNSRAFDDKLCHANHLEFTTDFDLLEEVRLAAGMPRHYVRGLTKSGYNLNNLALTNLGYGKTKTGELAPVLWQEGKKEEVIKYCQSDVELLRSLYFRFIKGKLYDPLTGWLLKDYQFISKNNTSLTLSNNWQKLVAYCTGGIPSNPLSESREWTWNDKANYDFYCWLDS